MSEIFDPAKIYLNSINRGCELDSEEQEEVYKNKRKESLQENSVVVISPSRSSFFRDTGAGFSLLEGKCQRQAFLDYKLATVTNKSDHISYRRMRYGQIYEAQEHVYEKKAGILIESNYRMEKKISDKVSISGELDSIVNLEGRKFIVEHKSYDGYYAEKQIKGSSTTNGMPKYDHIAQNMFYLAMLKEDPKHQDVEATLFHYRTRGSLEPTIHVLQLAETRNSEGKIVDAYPIINGTEYHFVSLKELITRGIILANHILNNTLPPREPDYEYSEDKIRYLLSISEISKTKFQEWEKGKTKLGSWQCSRIYCSYFDRCMGHTPNNKASWPCDEDILKDMYKETVDKTFTENW